MTRTTTDQRVAAVDPRGAGPSVLRRAGDAVRAMLGLRRSVVVDGVRYTERTSEPLRRALSRRGSGQKDFDAVFPGGRSMRIRATMWREYADLVGPRLASVYGVVEHLARPGMRVLDAGAGTGYGAAWLLGRVGPSGAVVALERDRESVRYAQARYPAPNVAFECGWLESLSGETDGSFDGVICCDAIRTGDDERRALTELWRLVAPGGWLLVAVPGPAGDGRPEGPESPRAFAPDQLVASVRQVIGGSGPGEGPDATGGGPTPADAGGRLVILVQRPE